MRPRRIARECALKILYSLDVGRGVLEEAWDRFWQEYEYPLPDEQLRQFVYDLISGVLARLDVLDRRIEAVSDNWDMQRMAIIDRDILRMAAFEILFLPDIPRKVSINEAVDLAKKYGDKDSGKFVNGILDKI